MSILIAPLIPRHFSGGADLRPRAQTDQAVDSALTVAANVGVMKLEALANRRWHLQFDRAVTWETAKRIIDLLHANWDGA